MNWRELFDERQQREIKFCGVYNTPDFQHGTNGHNERIIISKLANLLDELAEWDQIETILNTMVLAHRIDNDKVST